MSNRNVDFDFRSRDPADTVRLVSFGLIVLVVGLLVYRSAFTVDPSQQAVVLRFGRYAGTRPPGLHFCIPFVDEVYVAETRERTLRLPFGVEDDRPQGKQADDDLLMLTGELDAAAVEWTVQWRVTDPQAYLFTFHSQDGAHDAYLQDLIAEISRTVMNRLVGDYSFDEVLTGKRGEIAELALEATQAKLDRYKCGIEITDLQVQRVTPPQEVQASFDAVNEAVQQRDKLINEANKERRTLLPRAQADADKTVREAEGFADRRRAEVNGEVEALMAQYREYSKAPEETRRRLYLEAMEKVLSSVRDKTIIDSDLQQLLPLLNLGSED